MLGTSLVVRLDRQMQTDLATWAVLKAVLLPYYQRQPDLIPIAVYKEFFAGRQPSDNQHVLMGRHNEARISGGAHSYLLDITESDGTVHSAAAYAVTFHVERLVIHVFGHTLTKRIQLDYEPSLAPYVVMVPSPHRGHTSADQAR